MVTCKLYPEAIGQALQPRRALLLAIQPLRLRTPGW